MRKESLRVFLNHTVGAVEAQFARLTEVGDSLLALVGMDIGEPTVEISLRQVAVGLDCRRVVFDGLCIVVLTIV